ncbi:hypothetical protein ColKHC_02195 [Colletotrichum higginsianum]|nr:hypothetical protein ColKHC_02195 [Colletotrichum higginsianum]
MVSIKILALTVIYIFPPRARGPAAPPVYRVSFDMQKLTCRSQGLFCLRPATVLLLCIVMESPARDYFINTACTYGPGSEWCDTR